MPPAHFPLQGFSAPVVKADAISVAVVSGRGERITLSATPALWQSLYEALGEAAPMAEPAAERRPVGRPRRPVAAPIGPQAINQQKYQAILRQHQAEPHRSLASLLREHGIDSTRFRSWFCAQLNYAKNPVPEVRAIRIERFGSPEIPRKPIRKAKGQS